MSRIRNTNPEKEMTWMVVISTSVCGDAPSDIEWCATEALAKQIADSAVTDADENEYDVSVYVLQCKYQNTEAK